MFTTTFSGELINVALRQLGATAIHKTYADNEYNDDDF